MPNYKYRATAMSGKTVRGNLVASDPEALLNELKKQDLFLLDYTQTNKTSFGSKLKPKELTDFCRQLGSLLVGAELGQQIQARGDVHRADGAHRIRGGAAGGKGKYHCHSGKKCDQFLFHCYAPVVRIARPLRQRKRAATSPKGRGFGNFPQGYGKPPEAPPLGELARSA